MILLLVVVIFLGFLLVLGGYLFFRACRRGPDLPWLDTEAISKTNFAPHAAAIMRAHHWLREHGAKDVWIKSEDGLDLHGLWVEAENPIGSIMLVHGYHSTYLVDFGGALDFYHRQGLNILLPEQRCHGKSGGRYTTFGVKESGDMCRWLQFLNDFLWKGPVVLSGMSMGASTVMFMADETLPENVRGIIVDCGFTSPAEIIGKVFRDVTHLSPVPWIYGTELFARLLGGFSLWEKSSVRSLRRNKLPIFMVHGTADDFVPCEMTKRSFEVCGGDKQLHLVEGAGHGVSFLVDKEGYGNGVRALLKKAFGEKYELRSDKK